MKLNILKKIKNLLPNKKEESINMESSEYKEKITIEDETVVNIDIPKIEPLPIEEEYSEKIVYGITDKGNRRHNEDSILIKKIDDIYLLAVADGVGGHRAGDFASNMAVDVLNEIVSKEYNKNLSIEDLKNLLDMAHTIAHQKIRENAVDDKKGMGTTLISAIIKGNKCIIANTGDSRAYLIRDGNILDKTKDHSFVQALVDEGHISEERARHHPMKNIITSALGLDDFIVDIYEWDLVDGDVLLMSSDGLHDYVDREDILNVVKNNDNSRDIVNELFNIALKETKDNVSIIAFRR
jgi:protein phosphatase